MSEGAAAAQLLKTIIIARCGLVRPRCPFCQNSRFLYEISRLLKLGN